MPRRSTVKIVLVLLFSLAVSALAGAVVGESTGPPEILVSRQLLETAACEPGEIVLLSADPSGEGARPFTVAGSYEPTPDPFRFATKRLEARLHLGDLISLKADPGDPQTRESVSRINIALHDPDDVQGFAQAVASTMAGVEVQPTRREQNGSDPFVVLERFHVAIAVVTVIGSSAFLLALMVMRAEERRLSAGVLRLLGFSRSRILLEGLIEGLCIALLGAVAGVLIALAMQGPFNRFFQWRYDTALVFVRITPGIIGRCIALAVPLGVLAGFIASWTFLRRGILELLRR